MEQLKKFLRSNNEIAPFVLRVLLALVIFPHGAQKLFGMYGGHGFSATFNAFTTNMGIPAPLAFLAIMAESIGAIFLAFGLLTRLSAFGIMVTMIVASTKHFSNGFFMNWSSQAGRGEGFEFHILAVAIALALVIKGSGMYSADKFVLNLLNKKDK